LEEAKVHQGL